MRTSVIASPVVIALIGLGWQSLVCPAFSTVHAQEMAPQRRPRAPKVPMIPEIPFIKVEMSKPAPLWTKQVYGDFQTSSAVARDDALRAAARELSYYLKSRYPDFRYVPTPQFLLDQRMVDAGEDETQVINNAPEAPVMVRHKVTIELREGHLESLLEEDRHERSVERLWWAGRGLGGLIIALLALVGYVRLDDWTKGYLTLPLKLGAVIIALVGPAVLWWLI